MSSMEVDVPQLNGFAHNPSKVAKKSVHFGSPPAPANATTAAEITIVTKRSESSVKPKHKARRRARHPSKSEDLENGGVPKPISPCKVHKMAERNRHSRSGMRGGAGGKGTWGKLGEVYYDDGHTHDQKDPNYDSEEEEGTYTVSPSSPHLSIEEFRKQAVAIFKEYFEHGDTTDVAASLAECNIQNIKEEVVHMLVTVALEESASRRELASVLISDLYGYSVINLRDVTEGFNMLLEELDELSLDTPDAPEVLGNFMARAVADDCVPPAYIVNVTDVQDPKALSALKRAQLLLNIKHGMARLDNVWGVGGGQRPVMFLISKMNLLLKEYLSSGDCREADRCLHELEVPHFHHELVYEAIIMVLEYGNAEKMCNLLKYLAESTVLTLDQINMGFMRVFNDMTEIVLDAPNAYHTLSKFVELCFSAGFVSKSMVDELPQRGRKRFVSEGDGGAIKVPED
ncbi:Programmed cell death protein 4 [Geodia barretti]|uniref:Programmed cell death protein 4 n=1 Tax=Geodia barretti TaxID=519541 RepID=A0AA35TJN9_GEOBA|nr:Programmed cell death protein 4 [Geodia barretti]